MQKNKIKITCLTCKKEISLSLSASKKRKTCSYTCSQKHKWSNIEYRAHMRKAHQGNIPANMSELVAFTRSVAGRKMHSEMCKEIAGWNKGIKMPQISGANSYRWISDRSKLAKNDKQRNSSAHREWSRQIKNRDYWRCQIANDDCSGRVEAHHILGWASHPELRYEIKNGITLCHFHHPRKRSDEERYANDFQKLVAAKMQ